MSFESGEPSAWPIRDIVDTTTLRALAHPLRMRLMELLAARGPATATELAALCDQTPANCSWHLRQLAEAGFIEEAQGGKGRQRRWKFIPQGSHFADDIDDPEMTAAAAAASSLIVENEVGALRAWQSERATYSDEWRDAAHLSQSVAWMTPEELKELGENIKELFLAYTDRFRHPEKRPEASKIVRLVHWGVPALDLAETSESPRMSRSEDT